MVSSTFCSELIYDVLGIVRNYLRKPPLFHKYFLNMDISVTNDSILIRFSPCVDNICKERNVSQNLDIGPSFYFMTKNGKLKL